MKYLRATLFVDDAPHSTFVISENNLTEDIHVVADSMRRWAVDRGADQEVEVFEHDDDLVSGSIEGHRRGQARLDYDRGNQMAFRDHIIACLRVLKPGGVALPRGKAPIAGDMIMEAFLEASKHKYYKGQTLQAIDKDGHEIVFKQ